MVTTGGWPATRPPELTLVLAPTRRPSALLFSPLPWLVPHLILPSTSCSVVCAARAAVRASSAAVCASVRAARAAVRASSAAVRASCAAVCTTHVGRASSAAVRASCAAVTRAAVRASHAAVIASHAARHMRPSCVTCGRPCVRARGNRQMEFDNLDHQAEPERTSLWLTTSGPA